jgi:hypothetical protein
MNPGMVGTGLGGTLYVLLLLAACGRELFAWSRTRSSPKKLLNCVTQLALVTIMFIGTWFWGNFLIGFILKSLSRAGVFLPTHIPYALRLTFIAGVGFVLLLQLLRIAYALRRATPFRGNVVGEEAA